jgi:hypothetical protein
MLPWLDSMAILVAKYIFTDFSLKYIIGTGNERGEWRIFFNWDYCLVCYTGGDFKESKFPTYCPITRLTVGRVICIIVLHFHVIILDKHCRGHDRWPVPCSIQG